MTLPNTVTRRDHPRDCRALAVWSVAILTALSVHGTPGISAAAEASAGSDHLRATASLRNGQVFIELKDTSGTIWADGPYMYSLQPKDGEFVSGLVNPAVRNRSGEIMVEGTIGNTSVTVSHRIRPTATGLQENLELTNTGEREISLEQLGFGFTRPLETSGSTRLIACPFRRQMDNKLHDYSSDDLLGRRFSNSDGYNDGAVTDNEVCDHGLLRSEAWILTDGTRGLLVAKYNPEQVEYSMAAVQDAPAGAALRFGGAALSLFHEPRGATRIAPGQSFAFGQTSIQAVEGGWPAGYAAYRSFLNAMGHGIPADYNPPLNWNELFDVGWYHSDADNLARHYTRQALMNEAAKAREIGADLLYLDPGWEICEGTTRWDEKRLGSVGDFVREVQEKYGLKVGYRTIGRVYRDEFPDGWYLRRKGTAGPYRRPWLKAPVVPEPVPLARPDGRRNLALLPGTTVTASSLVESDTPFHSVEHLIDGWYSNAASWISDSDPSWVEVNLGSAQTISEIVIGSEHTPVHRDRAITGFDVMVSDSDPSVWKKAFSYRGDPVAGTRIFPFAPIPARRVRLEIVSAAGGTARIDELEIYEAGPPAGAVAAPVRKSRPEGAEGKPIDFWEVCTLSPEWQEEKIRRILAVTGGGMDFMMYDEFDWRGACYNPDHGHEIPSTPQGHAKAVFALVEKMREQFPHVLVEAHDPVLPWNVRYLPTYFRQGFTGNRFQENWGFEFMWHPVEDLKSGRALCLYYYNLGCDIPLYDHITMESDNDASLSFWWYASTVRHLGIGGKKGLNSKSENAARWQQYKKAVAEYNRLRPYYARGRFIGIGETAHLHLHPTEKSAVLNVFNLDSTPQNREVRLDTRAHQLGEPGRLIVTGAESRIEGDQLVLTFNLPPESPALAEIRMGPVDGDARPDNRLAPEP